MQWVTGSRRSPGRKIYLPLSDSISVSTWWMALWKRRTLLEGPILAFVHYSASALPHTMGSRTILATAHCSIFWTSFLLSHFTLGVLLGVCVCVCVCGGACMRACVRVYLCVHAHARQCCVTVCVNVCVSVQVCVHVCVPLSQPYLIDMPLCVVRYVCPSVCLRHNGKVR